MANVEHNRWNVEQLLMSFRPVTSNEQEDVLNQQKTKDQLKEDMAHFDICSNERILEIDTEAIDYDRKIANVLPEVYTQLTEQK